MRTLSAVPTTQSCIQVYLWIRDTSLYRTANWVPAVSSIERKELHSLDALLRTYGCGTVCVYMGWGVGGGGNVSHNTDSPQAATLDKMNKPSTTLYMVHT